MHADELDLLLVLQSMLPQHNSNDSSSAATTRKHMSTQQVVQHVLAYCYSCPASARLTRRAGSNNGGEDKMTATNTPCASSSPALSLRTMSWCALRRLLPLHCRVHAPRLCVSDKASNASVAANAHCHALIAALQRLTAAYAGVLDADNVDDAWRVAHVQVTASNMYTLTVLLQQLLQQLQLSHDDDDAQQQQQQQSASRCGDVLDVSTVSAAPVLLAAYSLSSHMVRLLRCLVSAVHETDCGHAAHGMYCATAATVVVDVARRACAVLVDEGSTLLACVLQLLDCAALDVCVGDVCTHHDVIVSTRQQQQHRQQQQQQQQQQQHRPHQQHDDKDDSDDVRTRVCLYDTTCIAARHFLRVLRPFLFCRLVGDSDDDTRSDGSGDDDGDVCARRCMCTATARDTAVATTMSRGTDAQLLTWLQAHMLTLTRADAATQSITEDGTTAASAAAPSPLSMLLPLLLSSSRLLRMCRTHCEAQHARFVSLLVARALDAALRQSATTGFWASVTRRHCTDDVLVLLPLVRRLRSLLLQPTPHAVWRTSPASRVLVTSTRAFVARAERALAQPRSAARTVHAQ